MQATDHSGDGNRHSLFGESLPPAGPASGPLPEGRDGGTHEQDRASWQRPQAGFRIRYMGHP